MTPVRYANPTAAYPNLSRVAPLLRGGVPC